jgi:microcystin-dependent protein
MTQTFTAGQTLTAEAVNAELAFPTGAMFPYAGSSAPSVAIGGVAAWLLCDGSAVSRTTYAALFAVVSTTYGTGDGSTTFNLPDLRGRIPVGAGTGAQNGGTGSGAISGGTALTARTRGAFGGDERLQNHTHDTPGSRLSTLYTAGGSPLNGWNAPTVAGDPTGNPTNGGGSGGNMPPFIITNYLIKT